MGVILDKYTEYLDKGIELGRFAGLQKAVSVIKQFADTTDCECENPEIHTLANEILEAVLRDVRPA